MLRNTLPARCLPHAIKRIGERLAKAREPFGLFVLRNDILLIKTDTTRFAAELRRAGAQQHLVGVYDHRARLDDVTLDLREHVRP